MQGFVFTGDQVTEEIGNYDLVVFLMKGCRKEGPLNILDHLYYETIVTLNIEKLYEFMAEYGFKNRDKLIDLWAKSELSFNKFLKLLKSKHKRIFKKLNLSILGKNLIEVLEKLNKRQGKTIIVGGSKNIPLFYIQLCIDDASQNIMVVDDASYIHLDNESHPLLLVINGIMLNERFDFEIPEGIPIIISESKNGIYLPSWINPIKNTVLMTVEMSDRNIWVNLSAKFAF